MRATRRNFRRGSNMPHANIQNNVYQPGRGSFPAPVKRHQAANEDVNDKIARLFELKNNCESVMAKARKAYRLFKRSVDATYASKKKIVDAVFESLLEDKKVKATLSRIKLGRDVISKRRGGRATVLALKRIMALCDKEIQQVIYGSGRTAATSLRRDAEIAFPAFEVTEKNYEEVLKITPVLQGMAKDVVEASGKASLVSHAAALIAAFEKNPDRKDAIEEIQRYYPRQATKSIDALMTLERICVAASTFESALKIFSDAQQYDAVKIRRYPKHNHASSREGSQAEPKFATYASASSESHPADHSLKQQQHPSRASHPQEAEQASREREYKFLLGVAQGGQRLDAAMKAAIRNVIGESHSDVQLTELQAKQVLQALSNDKAAGSVAKTVSNSLRFIGGKAASPKEILLKMQSYAANVQAKLDDFLAKGDGRIRMDHPGASN